MPKVAIFFVLLLTAQTHADWLVDKVDGKAIQVREIEKNSVNEAQTLSSRPMVMAEDLPPSKEIYSIQQYPQDGLPKELRVMTHSFTSWPGSEVRTIVDQGPSQNRIDLTIVGDGYTDIEKAKFFEDAQRITDDLFGETTFHSYLPLFNVHAVFVPSKESGLTDKSKVDTALGLYRNPAGSKRGIYPGNTSIIEKAISLARDTDYPILLANDDFYGGLGGRYAITTRSIESGSMVLRHELGHNFGNVGEEYDGGYVYQGANFDSHREAHWKYWNSRNYQVFDSKILSGDYVWQDLKNNPYRAKFQVPTGDYFVQGQVSTVGWSTAEDVHVSLDNSIVDLDGLFTDDRSFFYFERHGLVPGEHTVEAKENISDG
ncbi:MAG: hypothetical protein KDD25_10025, partial [Bdellovibrionales bacterium]|nr:hypothetical protein [Bdellovibrionales bacterium]